MMSSRFLPVSFFTAVLFFLSSCNGSEEKSGTDTSKDSTTTAITEPATPSTIVTTPQGILLVKHKVSNFTKWKASYDAHDSMRLAGGMHNYVIGRSIDDSNMVIVAVKADDMAKAKAFSTDAKLKEAMQKGGVTGKPSFAFLTATFQDTVVINSAIRSLTTFTVKDWDAWQKGFKEGSQERIDNGITDRVYGHDADDDHKIMLVTALMDTAKAFAYWKSDMLKKRRAVSGVIGVPDRFVFRIVQRY
ncbi:MAG: hypothetical protein H7Z13_00085 [Ferruginibacter sp.]|nr:hypothetical protein [Ferruginibacter sp.]